MKRLTTNKPVAEMSMYELAHNSCYAKDGNARYRDFEDDFDARELTIKLLEKFADIPNEFTCEDDFDDFMLDSLQYGTDSILGLIAVFYKNLWAMADLRETLKEYEDLEEKGRLPKLFCAVGDTVYVRDSHIIEAEINKIEVKPSIYGDICYFIEPKSHRGSLYRYFASDFNKTVFLRKSAAEQAMKERETADE